MVASKGFEPRFGSETVMGPLAMQANHAAVLNAGRAAADQSLRGFERIARMTARALGVPFAGICLGDPAGPCFIARFGALDAGVPQAAPFLLVAAQQTEPLVVADAQADSRFRACDAVVEHGVRMFTAYPLFDDVGERIGFLCALACAPRAFSFGDREALDDLAGLAMLALGEWRKASLLNRAEQELRLREAELHAMYEHAMDLIFILDRDCRYINVNPAYAAALGQPIEAILGQRSGYYLPPHAVERAVETNARILETGQPIVYDITLDCALGVRSFSVLKFPYRDQEGAIVGVIGIARDISERKALERQKSEFVTALSHEIRTPLFAIQNAVRLLLDRCCEPGSDKGRRMLSIAARNAERLVRLTHDVLSLEGVEAGAIPFEAEPCDASALLEEAASYLEGLAEQAGIALAVAAEPVRFEACPERVMQVLINLVGNAIKFSPAGTRVSLEASERGEEVLFAVRDQGGGIPGEDLYRVFDPFHQVQSHAPRQTGIGLGLPISREIVLAHGGRIWVESEVGRGSAFYVALPLRTRLRLSETLPR